MWPSPNLGKNVAQPKPNNEKPSSLVQMAYDFLILHELFMDFYIPLVATLMSQIVKLQALLNFDYHWVESRMKTSRKKSHDSSSGPFGEIFTITHEKSESVRFSRTNREKFFT